MLSKFISNLPQDLKYEYSLNGKQDLKFWFFFDHLQYLKYLIKSWYKFLPVLNLATPGVLLMQNFRFYWVSLRPIPNMRCWSK